MLLVGELGIGLAHQAAEVGLAGEQVAVDPDRAGLDRSALGRRDRRQELLRLHEGHDAIGQQDAAQGRDVEDRRRYGEHDQQPHRRPQEPQPGGAGDGPDQQSRAEEPQRRDDGERRDNDQ